MLTPHDVHYGRASQILEKRERTLRLAWNRNPERFVNGTPKPQPLPQGLDQLAGRGCDSTACLVISNRRCLNVVDRFRGAGRVTHTRQSTENPGRFNRRAWIRGYVNGVVIGCGDRPSARHRRSNEGEDMVFDPLHYLSLVERKIGTLGQAAPLFRMGVARPVLDRGFPQGVSPPSRRVAPILDAT